MSARERPVVRAVSTVQKLIAIAFGATMVVNVEHVIAHPSSWSTAVFVMGGWLFAFCAWTVALIKVRKRELRRVVVAAVRTPVFPGGHGCPAGSCPVCGMHDPDGTEYAWSVGLGVRRAHEACVEWLGEIPAFDPVALDPDRDILNQLAAESPDGLYARLKARRQRGTEEWGMVEASAITERLRAQSPKPMPSPGPGSATTAR